MILLAAMCAALAAAIIVPGPRGTGAWRRLAAAAGARAPAGVVDGSERGRGWWRPAGQRGTRDREAAVTEACLALVAELRTGMPPSAALGVVAGSFPDLLGRPAARVRIADDAAASLVEAARAPGAGPLRAVAAAWQVSDRTGAGLAGVLARVAETLHAEESVRREAAGQLASVRATTRLLSLLPVLTLLVLSGGGGRPLAFLLGTPVGLACLVLGAALTAAGVVWVERMVAAATRSSWSAS